MKPQTRVAILEIPYLRQEEKSRDSKISKCNQKSPPNRPIPRTLPRPPPRPFKHEEKKNQRHNRQKNKIDLNRHCQLTTEISENLPKNFLFSCMRALDKNIICFLVRDIGTPNAHLASDTYSDMHAIQHVFSFFSLRMHASLKYGCPPRYFMLIASKTVLVVVGWCGRFLGGCGRFLGIMGRFRTEYILLFIIFLFIYGTLSLPSVGWETLGEFMGEIGRKTPNLTHQNVTSCDTLCHL